MARGVKYIAKRVISGRTRYFYNRAGEGGTRGGGIHPATQVKGKSRLMLSNREAKRGRNLEVSRRNLSGGRKKTLVVTSRGPIGVGPYRIYKNPTPSSVGRIARLANRVRLGKAS